MRFTNKIFSVLLRYSYLCEINKTVDIGRMIELQSETNTKQFT